jgi:predicted Zn-dependent protease
MQIRPRTRTLAIPSTLLVVVLSFATLAGTQRAGEAALNLVSLDQEWAMRDELVAQVAQEKQLVNDRAALDYLNKVGRRIAAQTPLGNRRWDFYIVRDSAVNAFNLPGGLIFVNSGLIAEAASLDQLAGVMAHEIGHGAARHGTQLMTRAYGYNLIAGLALGRNPSQGRQIAAQLLGTGLLTNYSRGAEREADRLGVNYTYQAGYDPEGLEDFFGKLGSLRQSRPSAVLLQPPLDGGAGPDRRFRDLPAAPEELAHPRHPRLPTVPVAVPLRFRGEREGVDTRTPCWRRSFLRQGAIPLRKRLRRS